MAQTKYTPTEFRDIMNRILTEAATQANFNGTNCEYSFDDICQRLKERIGTNWEITKVSNPRN